MERNLNKNVNNSHPLNTSNWKEIDDSILENFRFAEGRRFHNVEGIPYFLANDKEEISRLQMHHYLYKYIWQSIYSAPMHEKLTSGGLRVLDSGCGPGTWILDMANSYNKSIFVGIDLSSSMFPSTINKNTPDNVVFLERNILDGFPFPSETFDFVHQGFMNLAFTENQWQQVILDMVRITKPGGWIEITETDIETYFAGPLTKKFMKSYHDLLNIRGINPFIVTRIENFLQATNKVVDIHVEHKSTSLGSHGKKLGEFLSCNQWASISHAKAYFCEFMGIPIDDYDGFVEKIKKEYDNNKSYSKSYRIYGRKKSIKN
ncbi:S-adenosyl-L-methionine-dependent methyltransferase [Glomus cerebriforme]|uniref:S-adenosyl-L-methionine-dependent methyltransferase n=1 Tax=Glomus cerebriforme TaxID=658196 RepID=A0A397SY35_9GLOM|nr:S-adenosyl-L-methionine-dependent methyltransferase [Glomus cerebriforme]